MFPKTHSRRAAPSSNSNSEFTIKDLLFWGKEKLQDLGREEAQVSAERLLQAVLNFDRTRLHLEADRKISSEVSLHYQRLIDRRRRREPVAYLAGESFFWKERLEVGPGCLIPRPETEILVGQFLEISGFKPKDAFSFLDLGSGSGAIGIAILREFPKSHGTLVDISPSALSITKKNIHQYHLENRTEVILSDLFSGLAGQRFDAILSNPPYLSESDWKNVGPEILFEPREALAGGTDGCDFYRKIAQEAPAYLRRAGWLALEAGIGQSKKIHQWLSDRFDNLYLFDDDAGISRVVMGQLQ